MRCAASRRLKSRCTAPRAICIPAFLAARWKIPRWRCASLLATLRDENGRVAIPGFYDGIAPLSEITNESSSARLPLKDAQFKKLLGVPQLFGERGFTRHRTTQRAADV